MAELSIAAIDAFLTVDQSINLSNGIVLVLGFLLFILDLA
jgi:hypothetical protein